MQPTRRRSRCHGSSATRIQSLAFSPLTTPRQVRDGPPLATTLAPTGSSRSRTPPATASPRDEWHSEWSIHYPPDATAGDFRGQPGMVQVIITANHDSFFGVDLRAAQSDRQEPGAVAARQRGNTSTNSMIALKPDRLRHRPGAGQFDDQASIRFPAIPDREATSRSTPIAAAIPPTTKCSTSSTGALNINGTASLLTAPKVNVYGGCSGPDWAASAVRNAQ